MEVRRLKDDELAHYGVKGMKWKHRKGPITDNYNISTLSTGPYAGAKVTFDNFKNYAEKKQRAAYYKNLAFESKLRSQARKKDSKKLIHKMKVFGQSFKEVHTENIQKGLNFVKKLFGN